MESSNIVLRARYVEVGLGITVVTVGFGLERLKKRKSAFIEKTHVHTPEDFK